MTLNKKLKKKKSHKHLFFIERGGGNKYIDFYDMACKCGLKMMVHDPSIHRGDLCERKVLFIEDINSL